DGTDFGDAPRRLAAQFAALAAEIAKGVSSSLALAGVASCDTLQPVRRELIRRVIALDHIMDESLGESSRLRYHSPLLQGAIDGLFCALAAWRSAVVRLSRLPKDVARQEANAILRSIPPELRSAAQAGQTIPWTENPSGKRAECDAAARALRALPPGSPSLRLPSARAAELRACRAAHLGRSALR